MSEQAYETWAPSKPADAYDDDEIRETPLFERLRGNFPNGAISLPEDSIIRLTRDAIKEMWATLEVTQFSDVIAAVFQRFAEAGRDHGNSLHIKFDPDTGIGSYDKPKSKGRKRFGHTNYAEFIGTGTPKNSPLYRECVAALREKRGLDASILKGGHLLLKTQMRSDDRNGVFELVLEKGRESNGVTEAVSAKLYQYPFVEQAVQVISFPPVSGEKGDLRQTDTIKEVPSMSQMLKQSILESAQTPAVMFGLVDLHKERKGSAKDTSNDNDGDDDDNDDSDREPVTRSKVSTPSPAPKPTASRAHALLDDDDEE